MQKRLIPAPARPGNSLPQQVVVYCQRFYFSSFFTFQKTQKEQKRLFFSKEQRIRGRQTQQEKDSCSSTLEMCAHVGHVHQFNSELWWIIGGSQPDNKTDLQWNISSDLFRR
ncbi:hypothetical protein CHARACLAT_008129 [Characodon lateralis]|uniref:Uncharacterized protein n=1 Tax=Characodon lateralis TaxID=208331 RepID=A0ABU7DYS9_9TELE|nr:hypothetical protein [Characodon lateralis]